MKPHLPNERKLFQTLFGMIFMVSISLPLSSQPSLLDPSTHPKFLNPLPIPARIDVTKGANLQMVMDQTSQWLGLENGGGTLMTTVWGYGLSGNQVTYPGPTFIAKKDKQVSVTWKNNLPGHFLPVDVSLHMAHPSSLHTISAIRSWYSAGNVPTVAHLHGGHTESASDGLPEAWFTQGFTQTGNHFVKQRYTYDNDQEAATLWYHDHALGITRLNVYAGLAGFYLLEDNNSRRLESQGVLPQGPYDIEIVIQDRMFKSNGELFWPAYPDEGPYNEFIYGEGAVLPADIFPDGGPSVLAEFFGDFIVVNGMVWPHLDVEPRPYRFRLLNGSDSRFYILRFDGGMSFLQIATDDGFLPNAVALTELVLAPGERAEIVVDFDKVGQGNSIELKNFGPDEPFKGFNPDGSLSDGEGGALLPADPTTTGRIMQFNVNQSLRVSKQFPVASVGVGDQLRGNPFSGLGASTNTRQLGLFEGSDEYGRLQPMLGASLNAGSIESLVWDTVITENPGLGDIETWEVYNFTMDAHPVHLHLVAFQIINRQEIASFSIVEKPQGQHGGAWGIGGRVSNITLAPGTVAPAANEKGWKDTFIVPPGWVGRVKARFDRPGRYVWHCHILSHEDHEMMRPYHVGPIGNLGLKSESADTDAKVSMDNLAAFRLYPNPMTDQGFVEFTLEQSSDVRISLYDLDGRLVKMDEFGVIQEGSHTITMPMGEIEEGFYILELNTGTKLHRERVLIAR